MRAHPLSLLLRPTPPSRALAVVAGVVLIVAETLVVSALHHVVPEISLGVVFLVGVIVVSTVWGLAAGVVMSVVSVVAFDVFHIAPHGSLGLDQSEQLVSLVILLSVALLLASVAELARTRTVEAQERRGEADLAAEMARLLLRERDVRSALAGASERLAQALGLREAAIELEPVAGDEHHVALVLRDGAAPVGTLLVPSDVPARTEQRLRERILPPLEALLRAAREREAMAGALVLSRDELGRLAEEQAALRRVATLVGRMGSPTDVFEAVTREVGLLSGADLARMERYESDGTVTGVAGWSRHDQERLAVGTRLALEGVSIAALVRQRSGPVRVESFADASGPIAEEARSLGIRASVGCPIVVRGRLWGVIAASSRGQVPFPAATESQMAEFTELAATAIANADSRSELAASRARVVATADETRRRIERDLHDGAQQRLVHTVVTLKLARAALGDGDGPAAELVGEALVNAERANDEVRELAHGILPSALMRGGLRAGTQTIFSRMRLPVSVDITAERLPSSLEATAYFIVAEATTNTVKHSRASHAWVKAFVDDGMLHIDVRDDGIGGAQLADSPGLLGLHDRAAAVGGELHVESPEGGGTVVAATLPIR